MNLQNLMGKLQAAQKTLVKNEKPVTPKIGVTEIILLPGWRKDDPEEFWREFGAHYIKVGGKISGFYPCDDIIYGKPCPVCAKLQEVARSSNSDEVNQFIKDSRANRQYLVNAIVIGDNNNEPVVMALSKTVFEQLITQLAGGWGQAVFHPETPKTIQINRTGTGFDTKYQVVVTPREFPLPPNTLNKLKNLDEYVDQRTDQLLNKAVQAISSGSGNPTLAIEAPFQNEPVDVTPRATQPVMQQVYQQPVQPVMQQPVYQGQQPTYQAMQQPMMQQPATQPVAAPWEEAQVVQNHMQTPQVPQGATIALDADANALLDRLNALK